MSERRGFRILPSYYDAIRNLPDDERLIVWDAVMGYGCAGIIPEKLSPVCNAIFILMKPTIEKSAQYFISQQEKAQGRQDALRQNSGTVPAQCQGSAVANAANGTGTVRDCGVIGDGDVMNDSGVAVSGDITAAALLKSLEIHDDKELIETVSGDLQRHGVEIVSEALKHAKASDPGVEERTVW